MMGDPLADNILVGVHLCQPRELMSNMEPAKEEEEEGEQEAAWR